MQQPARSPSRCYDLFLAHASADKARAEALYDLLAPRCATFLASRCLELGDDWDLSIARAQRTALVTVVLVSRATEGAYYEREEVAAAIAMARRPEQEHRVVPVWLDGEPGDVVPYGLRLKHGLSGAADAVAEALVRLVARLREPRWRALGWRDLPDVDVALCAVFPDVNTGRELATALEAAGLPSPQQAPDARVGWTPLLSDAQTGHAGGIEAVLAIAAALRPGRAEWASFAAGRA
jgi:hypothetical protein